MKLSKYEIEDLIERLKKSENIPEDYKYKLFPTKQKEYELVYGGKMRKEDILANEDGVFPLPLQVEKVFNGKREGWNDSWRNMIVFGDNLQFLKTIYENKDPLIKDKVKGKIKLIYIDPPFGTGDEYDGNKGQKGYSAKTKGAEFVEFLRRRIIVAKEILSDEGIIVVRNAYNFGHYVKIILDEIFSKENFINEIIIKRKRKSMGSLKKYEVSNEYLYVYSKTENYFFENQWGKKALSKIKWTSFLSQGERNPKQRILLGMKFLPRKGQHFSLKQEKVDKLSKEHFLRVKHKDTGAIFYYSETGNDDVFYKLISTKNKNKFKYQDITVETEVYGVKNITDIPKYKNEPAENFKIEYLTRDEEKITNDWTDIPSYTDRTGYPTENSEQLLDRVIKSFTKEGDIVLDFFAGSGTTAAVAEKLNRKWITCDIGKLSFYTIQKRILNIEKSKDLVNPKKKYNKPAKSFMTLNTGQYDLEKVFKLPKEKYVDFVMNLFEIEPIKKTISGIKINGERKDGYYALVWPYWDFKDASIDEAYLYNLHQNIGKKIGDRFYIIAPANYVDFISDYFEIDNVRYYFLKVPYHLIKELHKFQFKKFRQPQSKKNVNDLEDAIGFHFMKQPEVESEIITTKDQVTINIKKFYSDFSEDEKGREMENFESLAMVLIDKNFNGAYFDMDEYYFAEDLLKKEKDETIAEKLKKSKAIELPPLPKSECGKTIMIIYVDIFGNEFKEVRTIEK